MRIVLALDAFKGSMTAPEACDSVADGIGAVLPRAELIRLPMADGGEGTAGVMLTVKPGEWIPMQVTGPLPGSRVKAGYAWFPRSRTALVEMAAASGLVRLNPSQRNPMETTTYGTGELIAAAARRGAERILFAVGGSATVDGGLGAATALGWSARDAAGNELPPVGKSLSRLAQLVRVENLSLPPIEVLCDVTNPLLGLRGAARIFGPQKGATPDQVMELERGLDSFAAAVEKATGVDIRPVPGGGAAGGLAAGAYGLLGASLTAGARTVRDALCIPDALGGADWVLTGEGQFDAQSMQGKVVSAIVESAAEARVKVGVIAGRVVLDGVDLAESGIDAILASAPEGMPVEEAMAEGVALVRHAGAEFARRFIVGGNHAPGSHVRTHDQTEQD